MVVYSVASNKNYQLQGGILDANWVEVAGTTATAASGLTAFAGGGQASALALTATINRVTVCATAGDSVKLPAATAGVQVIVLNDGAASMDIFPQTGESIDALAANAAYALTPATGNVRFICASAGLWKTAAGGGGGATLVFGTRASPRSVVIATGVTSGAAHMSTTTAAQTIYAIGSIAGENDITANPQIQAGTVVGQRMRIIGRHNDNYIKLENGTGLDLDGASPWYSLVGNLLDLEWDGTNWYEAHRRGL